jgi:hypothetical protein
VSTVRGSFIGQLNIAVALGRVLTVLADEHAKLLTNAHVVPLVILQCRPQARFRGFEGFNEQCSIILLHDARAETAGLGSLPQKVLAVRQCFQLRQGEEAVAFKENVVQNLMHVVGFIIRNASVFAQRIASS